MSEITLKNVSKKYENGNFAVREFNLDIHDKEFIIFVGPSGCGKSTTLRMIAGLEDITDGELWIDGQLCNYIEPQQRGMSMVFQNYALYPNMTVYGNIAFALKIRKVPKAEIDGDMGDSHVGLQARLMSQALRKLTAIISKSNCIVIFINQLREKVGVMFGSPETTTGGRALKFYSSIRMDIRRIEAIKQGGEIVGNRTRVKVVKNKVAPPFKEAEFDIMFGKGISREGDILDLAANTGIVNKSGAWYSYNDAKIGQGRENTKNYFRENPEIMEEIEHKVRAHFGLEAEGNDENAGGQRSDSVKKGSDVTASETVTENE